MKRLETLEKLHDIKDKYNFNIHHDIECVPEMVYRHNGKNHHSKLGGKMFSEALLFTGERFLEDKSLSSFYLDSDGLVFYHPYDRGSQVLEFTKFQADNPVTREEHICSEIYCVLREL